MPPALNSANESPTFLKYQDWGGYEARLGFGLVAVQTADVIRVVERLQLLGDGVQPPQRAAVVVLVVAFDARVVRYASNSERASLLK